MGSFWRKTLTLLKKFNLFFYDNYYFYRVVNNWIIYKAWRTIKCHRPRGVAPQPPTTFLRYVTEKKKLSHLSMSTYEHDTVGLLVRERRSSIAGETYNTETLSECGSIVPPCRPRNRFLSHSSSTVILLSSSSTVFCFWLDSFIVSIRITVHWDACRELIISTSIP